MNRRIFRLTAATALAFCSGLSSAAFLTNGGLENPLGTWADTTCGYMAVGTGSTALTGWSVGGAATGPVVWAHSTTCDGFNASQGSYFVDLSGFGANAGAASLDQMLVNLETGQSYTVGLDYQGTAPGLLVNGNALAATASGSGAWTHLSGSFVATAGRAQLSLANLVPSARIVFIDNVTVNGPDGGGVSVAEPSVLALVGLALAGLVPLRRRTR